MRPPRLRLAALTLLVSTLVAGACSSDAGDGDGAAERSSTTTSAGPSAPKVDVDAVEAEYGDELRAMGLRVTRAALARRPGVREYGGGGRHLAIYLEPIGTSTTQAYLDRLAPLVRLFVPAVFDDLPEITSFDLCQEPVPTGAGDPDEPIPVTAFLVEREHRKVVSAATDLEDLIRLSEGADPPLELVVSNQLRTTSEWMNAESAATN
jgi:hypothetical protein